MPAERNAGSSFGPRNISWRVNAERIVLLGWSRAILMQLAHPLVAAGVIEHSTFRGGPLAGARRLHSTVRSMLALTFGDAGERTVAVRRIRGIHQQVRGRLSMSLGRFAAGTPYSADDPALLLWVHLTLLDSIPMAYDRLVRPLSLDERNAYCAEAASIAIALGASDRDVPTTWPAAQAQLDTITGSGTLAVGADARTLAAAVVASPISRVIVPLGRINRRLTVGWLPATLRSAYGFEWHEADDRHLQRAEQSVRRLRQWMPTSLAWWREARRR